MEKVGIRTNGYRKATNDFKKGEDSWPYGEALEELSLERTGARENHYYSDKIPCICTRT